MANNKDLKVMAIYFAIVGLAFFVIPAPAPMTAMGVKVLGLFVASIVAWTLTEDVWPSILSFVLALYTGVVDNITELLPATWGGDAFLFMVLMFVVIAYLQEAGFVKFTASWLLTRKVLQGRPWVVFAMLMFVGWIIAVFAGALAGMLLTWGFVYQVCDLMGYKPHSKQATAMVFGIALVAALSLSTIPFLQNALVIVPTVQNISGMAVNYVHYLAYSIPENLFCIAGYLLMCKYLWRVDLSAMAHLEIDFIPKEDLEFTKSVKYAYLFLFLLIAAIFAPSLMPADFPLTIAMKKLGNSGICFVLCVIWSVIRVDGKQVFNMASLCQNGVVWVAIWMCLAVFTFAALLSNPATGISAFMEAKMAALFIGKPTIVFFILVTLIAIVLGNLTASMVASIIMYTATLPIGLQLGVDPIQLGVLYTVTSSMAFCLPASTPAGQFMFLNHDWMTPKDILFYGIPSLLMMGAVALLWSAVVF